LLMIVISDMTGHGHGALITFAKGAPKSAKGKAF